MFFLKKYPSPVQKQIIYGRYHTLAASVRKKVKDLPAEAKINLAVIVRCTYIIIKLKCKKRVPFISPQPSFLTAMCVCEGGLIESLIKSRKKKELS